MFCEDDNDSDKDDDDDGELVIVTAECFMRRRLSEVLRGLCRRDVFFQKSV